MQRTQRILHNSECFFASKFCESMKRSYFARNRWKEIHTHEPPCRLAMRLEDAASCFLTRCREMFVASPGIGQLRVFALRRGFLALRGRK